MTSTILPPVQRTRHERLQASCRTHWFGLGATPAQRAIADEIRLQYFLTSTEYHKAGYSLYDHLSEQSESGGKIRPAFSIVNRNVQLFLAYSMLWESFQHICTAAGYTHFAQHGPQRGPVEDARTQVDRVLKPPYITDEDYAKIGLLRNGETVNGAVTRMVSRGSRELREFYGEGDAQSLTDMDAFLSGRVEVVENLEVDGQWHRQLQRETWTVRALDDSGHPLDPDSPYGAEKYRSVIKWDCYQIRHNLNFVGKSEGSIDDAILVMRAFCLLEPIVAILLQDSRKELIFAL